MTTTWKEHYKKSRAWDHDTHLVNADMGTKICVCCHSTKFTVEYPNAIEFSDHKLPVCLDCFRKQDGVGREALETYNSRECKKCGAVLALNNFAYRKRGNKLSDTCRNCTGTYEFGG
jgi:RNA polymerase subunit RPABC4/transcription elongation factor Spt4